VHQTAALVERHGGQAQLLTRSSREIEGTLASKAHAFWSGIYSRSAYREMERILAADRPAVVHVHNLYPLLSPSILVACRRAGVPVVMSIHNQQLTCPRADHLHRGQICERCVGGHEYHCVLRNCRQNLFESVAYALRSAVARKMRFFHDNVTLFIALSPFAKNRLAVAGFDPDRIVVLPNTVRLREQPVDPATGEYIAFAGRMSPEKGIDTLLDAAAASPDCPLRLAGSGPLMRKLAGRASSNVRLVGQLRADQMDAFYRRARFFVLPSKTFEMCPLVILEAMSNGLPVITSRIGAQSELVQDGVTGLLFDAGDSDDLARKMRQLWNDPQRCRQMGRAGYETAARNYGEDVYYQQLMSIYARAQAMVAAPPNDVPPHDELDAEDVAPATCEM
jgi:glycosyltransferase involved in cell wall biosynthesis